MKRTCILFLMIFAIGIAPADSNASLVYKLDKVISGSGIDTGYDFGTVTLTDKGHAVTLSVTLNTASDYIDEESKIQAVYWNYNDGAFGTDTNFTINSGTLDNSKNGQKADGFNDNFDLVSPGTGNLGAGTTWTVDIQLQGTDLNPEDFNFGAQNSSVYFGIHIGALETNINDSDSVWAGANPVPIPGAAWLLGCGLVGLVGVRRKFKE